MARSYVHEARKRVGPKRARIRPIIDLLATAHPDATIALNSNAGILPYSGIAPFGINGRFVYAKLSYGW